MQTLLAILGVFVLFFGRRLYWLAIGVLGFLVGVQLAGELLVETQPILQLLAAVVAGMIGALLAVVFQRVEFAIGGFFAGAFLANAIAVSVGVASDFQLVWLVIGGVVGAVIAALVMDWAIIALTSLVGAGVIVKAMDVSVGVTGLFFVILAVLGVAVQAWQFRPPKHTIERRDPHARSTTPH